MLYLALIGEGVCTGAQNLKIWGKLWFIGILSPHVGDSLY